MSNVKSLTEATNSDEEEGVTFSFGYLSELLFLNLRENDYEGALITLSIINSKREGFSVKQSEYFRKTLFTFAKELTSYMKSILEDTPLFNQDKSTQLAKLLALNYIQSSLNDIIHKQ